MTLFQTDNTADGFRGGRDRFGHCPVLYREVVKYIATPERPLRLIDGTLRCGGHSSLILRSNRQAELLGIDRDGDALERAADVLSFAAERIRLVRGNYGDLKDLAAEVGWDTADAILLDIGVSSPQLDDFSRGFSFREDAPLDMRMDRRSPVTASRILNHSSLEELARIFREYGEIRKYEKLARAVVERREQQPWSSTKELAELCARILGRSRKGAPPAPTLCFQALRIAVNDELGELSRGLEAAVELLSPGGILAVISFHSLEDRIVKNKFRTEATSCICPPGCPVCICHHRARLQLVTKKPLTAAADEVAENPRSACAKLRIAVKI
ncbi:MAG: 16S rRNA (cytosine(1402)-N(4))-methyltransferase RsmH [Victivallales bacterium]|nr:16S rRNA (cytosine(1402)-N(4))-methyltransferase RsmH [Victivallales bacterium]